MNDESVDIEMAPASPSSSSPMSLADLPENHLRLINLNRESTSQQQAGKDLESTLSLRIVTVAVIVFISGGLFTCAVLSKTAFVGIACHLNHNSTSIGSELLRSRSVAFVQLVIVLCFPQVVTVLKTLLFALCGKTKEAFPWPTGFSLLIGISLSVVESATLSSFTFLVITQVNPGAGILFASGIFAFSAFCDTLKAIQGCCSKERARNGYSRIGHDVVESDNSGILDSQSTKWRRFKVISSTILDNGITSFLATLLQLLSLAGVALYLGLKMQGGIPSLASIITCLLTLSFIWSPRVQMFICNSKKLKEKSQLPQNSRDSSHRKYAGGEDYATRRGGFIYAAVRLICLPFFSYLFIREGLDYEVNLSVGFTEWHVDDVGIFLCQIFGGLGAYVFALLALWSTFQAFAFTIPLLLSTPAAFGWYWLSTIYKVDIFPFYKEYMPLPYMVSSDVENVYLSFILFVLWISQILALGSFIWKGPRVPVSREITLFFSPYYDGLFLDSFLLLNRRTVKWVRKVVLHTLNNVAASSIGSTVFICSTMFHEREHEMRQMLTSIYRIAYAIKAQKGRFLDNDNEGDSEEAGAPHFESHIFFDSALNASQLNEYALQLCSVLEETIKVKVATGKKVITPYGMQLYWKIENVLPFTIHLKDNSKIKNKKRWSQVMYMNYIINFKIMESERSVSRKFDPHNTFILTTDADIDFTTESVAALLDFLVRDDMVGAVCARTHPLGSGPIIGYQVFEYAFGHWFQKSAEHVLGCVLCSPGCFSVFRVEALKEILPIYQSNVSTASEFLTKDMGEDRWLCTLLIKAGWKLEYAAVSENSTYCPDTFNEFYNQRRRWIPSTFANLIEVVSSAKEITLFNNSVNYLFILYQLIIIFTTVVSPATIILIVASGVYSAFGLNSYAMVGIFSAIALGFGILCLIAPEKWQLNVAKFLTFVFALIVAVAFVGLYIQALESIPYLSDYNKPHWLHRTLDHNFSNKSQQEADDRKNRYLDSLPNQDPLFTLPMPLDSIYLLGYSLIVILVALLHPGETYILLYFVLYIVGLPSAYMLLIIYSACNLNTRSWGTRVDKATETNTNQNTLLRYLQLFWGKCLTCFSACWNRIVRKDSTRGKDPFDDKDNDVEDDDEDFDEDDPERAREVNIEYPEMEKDLKKKLTQWKCERYVKLFEKHGYTRLEFINGLTRKDLQEIGIKKRGFQLRLFKEIRNLQAPLLESFVPETVKDFLEHLHLSEYKELFEEEGYYFGSDIENLIGLTEKDLRGMGITKRAHLRQLLAGLKRLQYPRSRDIRIRKAKGLIDSTTSVTLAQLGNTQEKRFWEDLVGEKGILKPEAAYLNPDADIQKKKLEELRNVVVVGLLLLNIIWMMLVLSFKLPFLEQWGINQNTFPTLFLVVYFAVIFIQFLALLVHRLETLLHVMARTYMPQKTKGNWYEPNSTMTMTYQVSTRANADL